MIRILSMRDYNALLLEDEEYKQVRSESYNFNFRKSDGFFMRWGERKVDDPAYSPLCAEILDLEIVTGYCSAGTGGCPWCYKANTPSEGTLMDFNTFKHVIDIFTQGVLTQVAFGITDVDSNPDFPNMLKYCRNVGVIPNYTTSGLGMTQRLEDITVELCGAVAVSVYEHNEDIAYRTIRRLISKGLKQVNAHLLYWHDNNEFVKGTMDKLSTIEGLNAAVLLALKPVGRAQTGYTPATYEDMVDLVNYAMSINLPLGFDSCTAPNFERWVREESNFDEDVREQMFMLSESCESGIFSSYVNTEGVFWPCSFVEGHQDAPSVDLTTVECIEDVWYNRDVVAWRERLLATQDEHGTRHCPVYNI